MKGSKNQELAFKALMALVASPELLTNYGAFAADTTKQQPFIDSINKQFAGITLDWSVPQQTLGHPDIPNHQAWMPDYAKSAEALRAFWTKYRTTNGLDLAAEEATLKTTLQGIFDAAD
jgi:hypothetical protein